MMEELLKKILEELKSQSKILEKLREPSSQPKIPPEMASLIENLTMSLKGTPMERTLGDLTNLLKRMKENGN